MSKLCAIIIDLDLMTEEEWKSLWDRKCTQFAARMKSESYDKMTEAIEKVIEESHA